MTDLTKEMIEAAIKTYIEPHFEKDLVSAKAIKSIAIDGGNVNVKVVMGFPVKSIKEDIAGAVKSAVEAVDGVSNCDVDISVSITAHSVQKSLKPIDNVKNITCTSFFLIIAIGGLTLSKHIISKLTN